MKPKQNKFKLNMLVPLQLQNLFCILLTLSAASFVAGGTMEILYTTQDICGTAKNKDVIRAAEKNTIKNVIVTVVALSIVYFMGAVLEKSKKRNDIVASRVIRRYIAQMRKSHPALRQYDYILDNDMAMLNIAAGVMNRMSGSEIQELSKKWDAFWYENGDFESKKLPVLKLKNEMIQSVIEVLNLHAETDPIFMGYLIRLIDSSAKTFALDKYTINQKVR